MIHSLSSITIILPHSRLSQPSQPPLLNQSRIFFLSQGLLLCQVQHLNCHTSQQHAPFLFFLKRCHIASPILSHVHIPPVSGSNAGTPPYSAHVHTTTVTATNHTPRPFKGIPSPFSLAQLLIRFAPQCIEPTILRSFSACLICL
jgi:hypothetical protein